MLYSLNSLRRNSAGFQTPSHRVILVAPPSALVIKHCSLIVPSALLFSACMCIAVVLFLFYLLDTDTDIATDIWYGLPDTTDMTWISDTDIDSWLDNDYCIMITALRGTTPEYWIIENWIPDKNILLILLLLIWCMELSATRNKVPHHTSLRWRPPLESTGATPRISLLTDTVLMLIPINGILWTYTDNCTIKWL